MGPFVQQLTAHCRANPTGVKWVLVPNHALGHTLGERLALEGTAWLNLRFRTPFDLALETAAPVLVDRGIDPVPEEIGPALVVRLLLELPDETPEYFRGLASQPRIGDALWSAVYELRMAGVRAVDLPRDAFTGASKHAELRALLLAYEEYLETRRLADTPLVYREALAQIDAAPVQPSDVRLEPPGMIWAPLQRSFLEALPGSRIDAAPAEIPNLSLPRRLSVGVRSPSSGQKAGEGPTVGGRHGQHRPKGPPASDADALWFLMAPELAPPPRGDGTLEMFRAGGRDAEVEEVFRRIAATSLPFDRFEIACGSPDDSSLVWQKAHRYGWPLTVSPGVPVLMTRPARALLGLCEWIESGYPASRLRRLLQSGDVTLNLDDGPTAAQAARMLGRAEATWGRATYASSLARLAASERERAGGGDDADADTRRRRLDRADRADRLRGWLDQVLRLLPDPAEGEGVKLDRLVSGVRVFVSSFAAKSGELDAAAVHAIRIGLDGLKVLGGVARPLSEAFRLLRSTVGDLTVGSDRARPGHLHVSSLSRAGHAGRPNVFVVGLEEGRVLPAPVEDAVLLDVERAAIHPALALSTDRVAEALYLVVSRLASLGANAGDGPDSSRATICLSYSCRDLRRYRQTFPSWLLLQARRLGRTDTVSFDRLVEELGEPVSVVPAEPGRAIGDLGWWLSGLRRAGDVGRSAVLGAFPELAQGAAAEAERASERFTVYDGLVAAAGPLLDPRTSGVVVSATRLERLATCPFRYFLEHGLGLEEADDVERDQDRWLDPLTRGSELHDLYATVMRRLREDPDAAGSAERRQLAFARQIPWLTDRAQTRLAELRQAMPPPSESVFEREQRELLYDLELFLRFELERGGQSPVAFEVAFGSPGGVEAREQDLLEPLARVEPVEIRLGGRAIRLRGRIDRINRFEQADRPDYEIIDYKTGGYFASDYDGTFRGGRLLQHALYGLVATELLRTRQRDARVASGAYYFPSARAGGQLVRIAQPTQAETTAVLTDLLDTVARGAFVHATDEGNCRWCGLAAACGRRPIHRARAKIDNAANRRLGPYRRLLEQA